MYQENKIMKKRTLEEWCLERLRVALITTFYATAELRHGFSSLGSLSPSTDEEREYMSKVPYSNTVGSLMYVMICTRLDISHALGVVSKYMHDSGKGHWQTVK